MSTRVIRVGARSGALHAGAVHIKRQTVLPQFQYNEAVRNAQLNALVATVGPLALLQLRSGPPPPACASAATGTLLAEVVLPEPWMAPAAGGQIQSAAPWYGTVISRGTVGHWRILDAARTSVFAQGTAGRSGSGAAMEFPVTDLEAEDVFYIEFAIAAGNR